MSSAEFESANLAIERPQTHALDRTASGIGCYHIAYPKTVFFNVLEAGCVEYVHNKIFISLSPVQLDRMSEPIFR
jgi:hypothetical protein